MVLLLSITGVPCGTPVVFSGAVGSTHSHVGSQGKAISSRPRWVGNNRGTDISFENLQNPICLISAILSILRILAKLPLYLWERGAKGVRVVAGLASKAVGPATDDRRRTTDWL